jgi:hypothetical protein
MPIRRRSKRNFNPVQLVDGVPHALAQGAEQAANRVVEAVDHVGGSRRNPKALLSRARAGRPAKLHLSADSILKAQLAKTSRELAHESSDLGTAVESLNGIIRANRKAAASGRTRLIGGVAAGAALMYHFDAEHGRQRRAETAHRLATIISGNRE